MSTDTSIPSCHTLITKDERDILTSHHITASHMAKCVTLCVHGEDDTCQGPKAVVCVHGCMEMLMLDTLCACIGVCLTCTIVCPTLMHLISCHALSYMHRLSSPPPHPHVTHTCRHCMTHSQHVKQHCQGWIVQRGEHIRDSCMDNM